MLTRLAMLAAPPPALIETKVLDGYRVREMADGGKLLTFTTWRTTWTTPTFTGVFRGMPQETSVAPTSRKRPMGYRTVTIEEQAERMARRVEALGWSAVPVPVSDGARRTVEKRRLLKVIDENAEIHGREPKFQPAKG